MAATNAVYPGIVYGMGLGAFDVGALPWAVQAVDDTVVFDRDDIYLDALSAGLLGAAVTLPSIAWTITALDPLGVELRAGEIDITTLSPGDIVQALVVFIDTGSPATSALAAWYGRRADTTPVEGVSDGSDLPVVWPPDGAFIRFPC